MTWRRKTSSVACTPVCPWCNLWKAWIHKHMIYSLTYWPLRDVEIILEMCFSNSFYELISGTLSVKLDTWVPLNLTDDRSTLVQIMVWCHQATTHYLSQCWPWSMSPYGVTKPQYVKLVIISHNAVCVWNHCRLWIIAFFMFFEIDKVRFMIHSDTGMYNDQRSDQ